MYSDSEIPEIVSPLSIHRSFPETYRGKPAKWFQSAGGAREFTATLDRAGASYRVKLMRVRKKPAGVIVLLLEAA